MKENIICISCPVGCEMEVEFDGKDVLEVRGNQCVRGRAYASAELTNPQRVVTSLFPIEGGGVLPCKTSGTVPKKSIFPVLAEIKASSIATPVETGTVLIKNVLGLGVDVVATTAR